MTIFILEEQHYMQRERPGAIHKDILARSTIRENIKMVSMETGERILVLQLGMVLEEGQQERHHYLAQGTGRKAA